MKEHDLQSQCVLWFHYAYPKISDLLFAIPNGAYLQGDATKRAMQWNRLKKAGAKAGVPDLFLSVPSGEFHGLYIEMKVPGNKQRDEQRKFEAASVREGYRYEVVFGLDHFISVVSDYVGMRCEK